MSDYGIETGYYRGNHYVILVTKTTKQCIYYLRYYIVEHDYENDKFIIQSEYHTEPKKALILEKNSANYEHEISFKQPYNVGKTYFHSYRYFTLDKIDEDRVQHLP